MKNLFCFKFGVGFGRIIQDKKKAVLGGTGNNSKEIIA